MNLAQRRAPRGAIATVQGKPTSLCFKNTSDSLRMAYDSHTYLSNFT